MTGHYKPPYLAESADYCSMVVDVAATKLRLQIDNLVAAPDADIDALETQMKIDPKGVTSPATKFDKATEALIGTLYEGTGVRVDGEEGETSWPEGPVPAYVADVDPIDGTKKLIEHIQALIEWQQLPQDTRGSRPLSGPMVSVGIRSFGSNTPIVGGVAAPVMDANGIVKWVTGSDTPTVRIEPDGSRHELPLARDIVVPETGGVILVASKSAEDRLNTRLKEERYGERYRVICYESAVAIGLCMIDQDIGKRLMPGVLGKEDIVVAAVTNTSKDWDDSARVAMANSLGHYTGDKYGEPRPFGVGSEGAILAVRSRIGREMVRLAADY